MQNRYLSFNAFLKKKFNNRKIRKIPINAGFSCPNKNGNVSGTGCIFCDSYGSGPIKTFELSIRDQIEAFIGGRTQFKYIAYYQAHANTYAPVDELREKYEIIFDFPGIVGLFIGTRPDAIALAVFDHGSPPPGTGEQAYRFAHLTQRLRARPDLTALAYMRADIPADMPRMRAVAASAPPTIPLMVMDTAFAALLGSLQDQEVRARDCAVLLHLGTIQVDPFAQDLCAGPAPVVQGRGIAEVDAHLFQNGHGGVVDAQDLLFVFLFFDQLGDGGSIRFNGAQDSLLSARELQI